MMTDLTSGATQPSFFVGCDFDTSAVPYLEQLADDFDFVGRYTKNLTPEEVTSIKNAGLSLLLIYEAGANNALGGTGQGVKDAEHFLSQANSLLVTPQPKSAIFATCDASVSSPQDVQTVLNYWRAFSNTILGHGWQVGGYADGTLQVALVGLFHDRLYYPWSPGAEGWSGTRSYDKSGLWSVKQGPTFENGGTWPPLGEVNVFTAGALHPVPPQDWPDIGLPYDPDISINLDWSV